MRIGISCYDLSVHELIELATAAEGCGFDSLWLGEHILAPMVYGSSHPAQVHDTDRGGGSDHNGKPIVDPSVHLTDPLVALAAVAASTRTLRLATGIYLLPLRHPLAVARSVATLQEAAAGRFSLGVGSGWLREEFEALAVPYAGRTARLEEQLAILRLALNGGFLSFHGDHYAIDEVQVCRQPVRLPLVLGGNSEPALQRAVRLADGWFTSGVPSLDEACRLRDRLAVLSDEQGRSGPLMTTWRVASPDPGMLDRYQAEGFENLLLMAYDVWTGPDLPARKEKLETLAQDLGLRCERDPSTIGARP